MPGPSGEQLLLPRTVLTALSQLSLLLLCVTGVIVHKEAEEPSGQGPLCLKDWTFAQCRWAGVMGAVGATFLRCWSLLRCAGELEPSAAARGFLSKVYFCPLVCLFNPPRPPPTTQFLPIPVSFLVESLWEADLHNPGSPFG